MYSADKLVTKTRAGSVYRRENLKSYSTSIDRDLKTLESKGLLIKVGPGLYYRPEKSRFGMLPPNDELMVEKFLKSKHFLMLSPTDYTMLGLGLTQTYNEQLVYNEKRYTTVELNGKLFKFVRPPAFPNKLTKEYLLVDLVNRIKELAEDHGDVLKKVEAHLHEFDRKKLLKTVQRYGKIKTKRFFEQLLCLSTN